MVLKAFPKTIPWNHKKQKIYHFSGPLFWYAITHTQVFLMKLYSGLSPQTTFNFPKLLQEAGLEFEEISISATEQYL